MKIRTGFVSNSSSTSFVVLLPKDFSLDNINLTKYLKEMEEDDIGTIGDTVTTDGQEAFIVGKVGGKVKNQKEQEKENRVQMLKSALDRLRKDKILYDEEEECSYILKDILQDAGLVIGEIETGPEGGQVIVANANKIKKILQQEAT